MKRLAPSLIVLLAAISTCTWATTLYRSKLAEHTRVERTRTDEAAKRASSGHSIGNSAATVLIEEFGDFQCPPCGMLSEPLNQIVQEFQPNVRLIYRNFPLPVHAHALEAARAAESAGLQGKFWEMHDLLYREQAVWSTRSNLQELFSAYAAKLGLDVKKFQLDMIGENTKEIVEKDQHQGKSLGVTNTPTIFINDQVVPVKELAPPELRKAVENAVKNPRPSPSPKK